MRWGEKRYHSLDWELKNRFGEKIYKITLNGGMTCPNRDGRVETGGCIFCSAHGSGDFAGDASLSVTEFACQDAYQIDEGPEHGYGWDGEGAGKRQVVQAEPATYRHQQLKDAGYRFAGIEAVCAEASQKKAEHQRRASVTSAA